MVAEGAVGTRGTTGLLLCTATSTHFTSLNGEWERDLGWTKGEMTSRPFADFIHPNDRDRVLAEAAKVGLPGYEVVNFENRFRAHSGEWRWLRWTARADGQGWVAAAVDVTSERELEPRPDAIPSGAPTVTRLPAPRGGDVAAPPAAPYGARLDPRLLALRAGFAVICLVALLVVVRGIGGSSATGSRTLEAPELLPHMFGPLDGSGPVYTLGPAAQHPPAMLGPRARSGSLPSARR